MQVDNKEKKILETALEYWEQQQLLPPEKTKQLRDTLQPKKAAGQVAQYFFVIAMACALLAFIAIFIDDKLLEQVKKYFNVGNLIIAGGCTIIAIAWFGYLARKKHTLNTLLYELYTIPGALAILCAIVYFCKDLGFGAQYTGMLITASAIFFIMSVFFRSRALWVMAIMALMGFYGSYADFRQNERNMFIGMNYPVRFTVFGIVVLALSFIQDKIRLLQFSQRQTYIAGMLIFFTGMWGVSIFGNFGQWSEWEQVRQVQVVGYSVVLAIASVAALLLGIKYRDDATRDFGIIFILLNIYSRYFEFFWNTTNKGIFFLILAASFALVGWQIEKRLRRQET